MKKKAFEADRIQTAYNWLQYYNPEEPIGEIEDCGLIIDEFSFDVAGSPYDS